MRLEEQCKDLMNKNYDLEAKIVDLNKNLKIAQNQANEAANSGSSIELAKELEKLILEKEKL